MLGKKMAPVADVKKNSPREHTAIGHVHRSSQGGPC
jgi:hypothetical protein